MPGDALNVSLGLKDHLSRDLRRTLSSVRLFTNKARSLFRGVGRAIFSVKGAIIGLGAGLTFREVTRTIAGFEEIMLRVRANLGATAEEMAAAEKTARDLGATTRYSATEAGQAILALGKNWGSTQKAIDAVSSTLDLATVGEIELAEAAQIAARTINQFGLSTKKAGHVVDILVNTSKQSGTNITDMAEAMIKAGGVASVNFGRSLEEVAAALGVLGDKGLTASEAGTNLRNILLSLSKPTDEALESLRNLGLEAEDVHPRLHTLSEVFKTLADSQGFVTEAQFIFEKRNVAAATTLVQMHEKLAQVTRDNERLEGTAKSAAEVIESSLGGAWASLKSALQELVLGAGGAGLLESMKNLLKDITEYMRSDAVKNFAERLGEIVSINIDRFKEDWEGLIPIFKTIGEAVLTTAKGIIRSAHALRTFHFYFARWRKFMLFDLPGEKPIPGTKGERIFRELESQIQILWKDINKTQEMLDNLSKPVELSFKIPIGKKGRKLIEEAELDELRQLLREEVLQARELNIPFELPPGWTLERLGLEEKEKTKAASDADAQTRKRLAEKTDPLQKFWKEYKESVRDASTVTAQLASTGLGAVENAVGSLITRWKDWKEIAKQTIDSIVMELGRIATRLLLIKAIEGVMGLFGGKTGNYGPPLKPGDYGPRIPPDFRAQHGGIFSGPASGYPVTLHGREKVTVEPLGSRRGGEGGVTINLQTTILAHDAPTFDQRWDESFSKRQRELAAVVVKELRSKPGLNRAARF
jgi:TP901 family phage tail tape measure protein